MYPAKVDVRLGIVKDFVQYHANYIGACRDLGVPYRLVDISGPDWIDRLEQEPRAPGTLGKKVPGTFSPVAPGRRTRAAGAGSGRAELGRVGAEHLPCHCVT